MLTTGLIADSYKQATTGFRRSLGTQVAASSGSTLVITTTGLISVGDLVVVRVAADNLSATTPTFTCADSGGNTYIVHKQQAINATAALGISGAIICSKATSNVATGGTITVTLSGAVVARAAYAESFFGYNNIVRSAAVSASGASTAATVTSGTVNSGDLVLGCICLESRTAFTGDSDTLNGSWSTLTLLPSAAGGTDATRVEVGGQYKFTTGAGAQTYNATVTSAEWAALIVVLKPDVGSIILGAKLGTGLDNSSGTSITVTTTDTVPPGGFIVFAYTGYFPTTVTVSGGGLTWTTDSKNVSLSDANQYIGFASAQAPSGLILGTVLTFTYSGDTFARYAYGCFFTGIVTSSAKDANSSNNSATGTAWVSASVTTTNTYDLIVGAGWIDFHQGSTIPATGYTEIYDFSSVVANGTFSLVYRTVFATGVYTPGGTWDSSGPWIAAGIAYKAA